MVRALISEHAKWLSALLRGLTRSETDAEDAFQDVWLRIIKLGGIPKGASPRAYLAQVARSTVVDHYRKIGREEATELEAEELVDDSPTPERRFETKATKGEIRAAVRALPFELREVVMLRIEAELKFEEIAAELELPLGTVLTRMRRATAKLKAALEEGHG